MFLVPGEVGGSEPLLTNLVRAMMESNTDLTIFAVRGFSQAYPAISHGTEVVEVPWSSGAQVIRIAAEHSWLQVKARRLGIEVLHHGVGTTPYLKTLPTVVTIHDIQYHHFPSNFVKLKRLWLQRNVPHSVRRSDVISVPSQWVKQDIVKSLGGDPDAIVVVPFGSEHLFDDPAFEDEVRSRYRLDRPYLYFPGRTYPHKNHRFLLEAFAPLGGEAELVMTGAPWFRDGEIIAAARSLGITGSVRHLGSVPRRDVAGLLAGAQALVYPTRFEGFGAPALEAMSLGCPVIVSNATAVPEVVGDAGILLDPDDLQGWREMMSKVLADGQLRLELSSRGSERSRMFTWEKAAKYQIAAYEQALAI